MLRAVVLTGTGQAAGAMADACPTTIWLRDRGDRRSGQGICHRDRRDSRKPDMATASALRALPTRTAAGNHTYAHSPVSSRSLTPTPRLKTVARCRVFVLELPTPGCGQSAAKGLVG